MTKPPLVYPFSSDDAERAYREWGCNCGPSALAFVLQVDLDQVRPLIPGFDEKRYTSPSMMGAAITNAARRIRNVRPVTIDAMFDDLPALVRIQWTGPWTAPGANPKWAYRQTHWIATFRDSIESPGDLRIVFDINSGVTSFGEWESRTAPALTAMYPRADGGWLPTHIWRLLH